MFEFMLDFFANPEKYMMDEKTTLIESCIGNIPSESEGIGEDRG